MMALLLASSRPFVTTLEENATGDQSGGRKWLAKGLSWLACQLTKYARTIASGREGSRANEAEAWLAQQSCRSNSRSQWWVRQVSRSPCDACKLGAVAFAMRGAPLLSPSQSKLYQPFLSLAGILSSFIIIPKTFFSSSTTRLVCSCSPLALSLHIFAEAWKHQDRHTDTPLARSDRLSILLSTYRLLVTTFTPSILFAQSHALRSGPLSLAGDVTSRRPQTLSFHCLESGAAISYIYT